MRYRDLPGWGIAAKGARELWRSVPAATWEAIGDLEAPAWQLFLSTPNELFAVAQERGLVKIPIQSE